MSNHKNAIVVLGGGLVKEKGKWQTTNFKEKGDKFGVLGDRLRVVAASYLYKNNPEQIVIASGGRGQVKTGSDEPAVATVIKEELEDLSVPASQIIKETKSKNTYAELIELQKIIKEKKINKVIIISNRYHLPRLKAIIKHCPELAGLKKMFTASKLKLKSAEEVLIKYDSGEWQKIIKKAYDSVGMKERVRLEEKGVRDIKSGKYKFK